MKAIGLTQYLPIDDPSSLMDVALPTPVPGERDLLVRVEAISVNPVDCKVRISKPGITEATPRVLGWDAAGVVEAVGSEAVLFKPGDEVFYAGSITRPGANSEFQQHRRLLGDHEPGDSPGRQNRLNRRERKAARFEHAQSEERNLRLGSHVYSLDVSDP